MLRTVARREATDVFRLMAILMLAVPVGCMAPDRIAYGPMAARSASIEGFGDIRMHADTPRGLTLAPTWLPIPTHKEINYLVLSGGGGGGAFSVGVLEAWSDKGQRPDFDIVSGVSTGALIAPYAFLGSAYDKALVELFTSGVARQLVDMDFLPKALLGASLLKQAPLRRMVERHLTRDIVAEIAAEHRKGRRLLVLTANLDSQRPVIWNMGAIANSERPDALKLFQDVIIASASVPGIFPAVLIKARSESQAFEEMHADGGSLSQLLTIPEGWMANADKSMCAAGLECSMYIIVNNALMSEFSTTKNSMFSVMARASSSLIKAHTLSTLIATYFYAQKNSIRFRVASIDTQVPYTMSDPFNTKYMRAVYNLGYARMASDSLWQDRPLFADKSLAMQPTAPTAIVMPSPANTSTGDRSVTSQK